MTDTARDPAPMRSRSFLGNAAIFGVGNVLIQAAGILLLPIYLRYLSPGDYGTLEVLNRMGEILAICLLAGGLRQATLTFYRQARGEDERRAAIGTSLALLLACGLAGAVMAAAAAGPLQAALGVGDVGLMRLAIVAIFLEGMTAIPLALIRARLEAVLFIATTLAQFLARVVLIIAMVVGLGWGVRGVLAGTAATSGLVMAGLLSREFARGVRFDRAKFLQMARFTFPFLPSGLCGFLMSGGDRFFLLHYGDEAEVGVYALGYKLASIISMLSFGPLFGVWCATMYDASEGDDAPDVFGRTFTRILAAYVAVGLAICLLQDEIILSLGDVRYAGATTIIAPVALAYGFLSASYLLDAGFYIRRRTVFKAWISLAGAVVTLGLCAVLIRFFGAFGAALATLGGFVSLAALTYYLSQRVFPVRYEWRRLSLMVGLAVLLWAASRTLPAGGWAVAAKAGLWLLWPTGLWRLGLFDPQERRWIASTLGGFLARLHGGRGRGSAVEVTLKR